MRNESQYTISIDLIVNYRQPRCSIDRADAEEELTDLIAEHQETIASLISDLIDQDCEIDQVETARFMGTRILV
jgi:hypothetical protein